MSDDVDRDGILSDDGFGDMSFGDDFGEGSSGAERAAAVSVHVPDSGQGDGRNLTKRQKAIRVMLRRADLDEMPTISHIMRGKGGEVIKISDIAIFIDEPRDELMAEIAAECKVRNRVNLSAEVLKSRVIAVGSQIMEAARMYQPIQVARIKDDEGNTMLECTSGRHRLVAIALIYGCDSEIPVYVENMTLNEARDAVVVANQARPTKAMERAEHAVLRAVGGDISAGQDEMYEKTAKTKAKARKYCVYSVVRNGYPKKLTFKVSMTSSRKDGGLTTLTNVENFMGAALEWSKEMSQKEFDKELGKVVTFLNAVAKAFKGIEGFDPAHHMASMTMSSMGKYYKTYGEITGDNPVKVAPKVAEVVVSMGKIGRQKSEETYEMIAKAMRG